MKFLVYQKKEVKILDKYMFKESQLRLKIKGKVIKYKCPKCGGYHTKRYGKGYETVIVNHMFLSNYMTVQLEIEKRRFICRDCEKNKGGKDQFGNEIKGSTFSEVFSFIDYKFSYSNTFKSFILREWEFSSISELSRKFKVCQSKVYTVINETTIEELETEKIEYMLKLKEIQIGIDEFSFSGRDYLVQINDLKTKKIIGILRAKDNKSLESWLNSLPIEVINKISGIRSDMNAGFKNVVQEHIAKRTGKSLEEVKQIAKASVDHYHLKQLLHKLIMEVYSLSNWMIKAGHYDKTIKDLATLETKNFNKYRTEKLENNVLNFKEYKPNNSDYNPITLGYFLSKRYNTLLLMKSENLTKKQEFRLNQILYPQGAAPVNLIQKDIYQKPIYEKNCLMKLLKQKIGV